VTLILGETLLIPKGWWHNVFSPADTIGLPADITTVEEDDVRGGEDATREDGDVEVGSPWMK
jgi:hypothetical protein